MILYIKYTSTHRREWPFTQRQTCQSDYSYGLFTWAISNSTHALKTKAGLSSGKAIISARNPSEKMWARESTGLSIIVHGQPVFWGILLHLPAGPPVWGLPFRTIFHRAWYSIFFLESSSQPLTPWCFQITVCFQTGVCKVWHTSCVQGLTMYHCHPWAPYNMSNTNSFTSNLTFIHSPE